MDFGALPPEVNSGRMYAGAGAGPLLGAALAWDGLSAELGSAASSYRAVVGELTSQPWLGPAAASMAAAAVPYVAWMEATASQAELTAGQARAVVAAFEAAFAATVPPPVIAANRSLLMSLVASNLLGQNSAAIAATEAQYAEMWAQDAAAMFGYGAAAEAACSGLTPFTVQSPATTATGVAAQAAAVDQAAASGGVQTAQSAAATIAEAASVSGNPLQPFLDFLQSPFNQLLSGTLGSVAILGGWTSGIVFIAAGANSVTAAEQASAAAKAGADSVPSLAPPTPAEDAEVEVEGALLGADASGVAAYRPAGVGASAMLGQAGSIGGLSVPQSLGTASPAIRLAAAALPMDAARTAAIAPSGMLGGLPIMGSVVNAPRNGETRQQGGARLRVLPNGRAAVTAEEAKSAATAKQLKRTQTQPHDDPLSDKEREELDRLRAVRAELAMERDAAARLIKEAIR